MKDDKQNVFDRKTKSFRSENKKVLGVKQNVFGRKTKRFWAENKKSQKENFRDLRLFRKVRTLQNYGMCSG